MIVENTNIKLHPDQLGEREHVSPEEDEWSNVRD